MTENVGQDYNIGRALNELGALPEWADLCRHLERSALRELSLAQCPGRERGGGLGAGVALCSVTVTVLLSRWEE